MSCMCGDSECWSCGTAQGTKDDMMSKPLKGYPFSDKALSTLLEDVKTHGEEDRSLMRDYAHEMARRLRALDEYVNRQSGPSDVLWRQHIRRILDGDL